MSIPMHQLSVAVYSRMLRNLVVILDEARANATQRKFEPDVLVSARLAPDMFPLSKQIQIACDFAKGGSARLAGVEIPQREDNETTLAELKARIEWTLGFINSIPEEKFAGADQREVTHDLRALVLKKPGLEYLQFFSMPNFYFHVTTAYVILRHNGVPLGKPQFIGGL